MVGEQPEVTEMRLAVQSLEQAGGNDVLSITHAAMRSCGLTASEIASSIHKLADTNNPGCFTRSLVSVHHRKSTKLLFTTSLAVLCEAKLVAVHFLPGFRMGHLRCDL